MAQRHKVYSVNSAESGRQNVLKLGSLYLPRYMREKRESKKNAKEEIFVSISLLSLIT